MYLRLTLAVVRDHPYLRVHVDAAWAGVALSCPEYREMCYLDDINAFADSFCTNFHKACHCWLSCLVTNILQWGLINFDASTLWVRDRKYLTEALDITPPFLRTKQGDAGKSLSDWYLRIQFTMRLGTVIDYRNWHLALGRRFRSLKFWFVLRSYGVEGFQKHIRKVCRTPIRLTSWC